MPSEDFRIRITRDGKIYFSSQQIGEERLRQLREMLEDCLGPVQLIDEDDDGHAPGVQRAEEIKKEEELRRGR